MAGADPIAKPALGGQPPQGAIPAYQGGDFAGPTQRPGEPITSGAPIGAGPGPEALSMQPQGPMPDGYLTNMLASMSATDTTGTVAKLYALAQQRGV